MVNHSSVVACNLGGVVFLLAFSWSSSSIDHPRLPAVLSHSVTRDCNSKHQSAWWVLIFFYTQDVWLICNWAVVSNVFVTRHAFRLLRRFSRYTTNRDAHTGVWDLFINEPLVCACKYKFHLKYDSCVSILRNLREDFWLAFFCAVWSCMQRLHAFTHR